MKKEKLYPDLDCFDIIGEMKPRFITIYKDCKDGKKPFSKSYEIKKNSKWKEIKGHRVFETKLPNGWISRLEFNAD